VQQADSLYNKITRTLKYVTVLGKESKTK